MDGRNMYSEKPKQTDIITHNDEPTVRNPHARYS